MNYNNDVAKLAYELTHHIYLMNKGKAHDLFTELDVSDYIALHRISHSINEKNDTTDRTYLKDIAAELRLTISQASKMVGNLRDKGLVSWSHDGNGSDGTYITITDSGTRLMEKQEGFLKDYYGRVTEKFGNDNMVTLLQLMIELEKVMDAELNSEGDDSSDI